MNENDATASQSNPTASPPTRLEIALKHIEFARSYSTELIQDIEPEDWFWQPAEGVTHIAWQVGHMAMAQYGLTLFRQRGRQPIDLELMSGKFRKRFARGTTPSANRDDYPTPEEILTVFHRVHEQMLIEVPTYPDQELDEPVDPPYAGYATRYGALLLAGDHEMIHAGQIGLLRRLIGKPPIR